VCVCLYVSVCDRRKKCFSLQWQNDFQITFDCFLQLSLSLSLSLGLLKIKTTTQTPVTTTVVSVAKLLSTTRACFCFCYTEVYIVSIFVYIFYRVTHTSVCCLCYGRKQQRSPSCPSAVCCGLCLINEFVTIITSRRFCFNRVHNLQSVHT
jgi:hypothetical protein